MVAIEDADGRLQFDWEWKDGQPNSRGEAIWQSWISDRIGPGYFGHVTTAVLALGATDDQMAAVGKLTHLESLFVPGSITDNGLIHLEGLSELAN